MTTHRSRTKLERKAHMNIHDTLEVREFDDCPSGGGYTRDRFGKRHSVPFSRRNLHG